ncbi:hypothetical protein TcasGA2_TC000327 [Tribolium castaneum]|uniref:Uncharacterized protein n=1 Tax=Tribolium castaneum TaxID=7070 RepID=D6WAW6_TRICA|nr:PREDICTED: uncharacterized protein LOC103315256 [Tribolium castaneum]EEZ97938.1 hypothetical protein TcasGA2_TC000327 [Tribolium castaneum]|eukprot:XP_008201693.1 PREDICTED: uncharacterized protein LOC103315256 [Tribolium castaneum]
MSGPTLFSFPIKGATKSFGTTLQVTDDQNVLKIGQSFTPPATTLISEITNSTVTAETATTPEISQNITTTITTVITEVTDSTTETIGIFENNITSAVAEIKNSTQNTTSTPLDVFSSTTDVSNQIYYEGYDVEGKTLYVVLGVIIVSLLLIIVILIVVYKRYKASRSGSLDCATDLSQVTISNGRMKSY